MFAAILFSALVAGTVAAPVGNSSTVLAPPGDVEGILDCLMHQNFGAEGGQPHLHLCVPCRAVHCVRSPVVEQPP